MPVSHSATREYLDFLLYASRCPQQALGRGPLEGFVPLLSSADLVFDGFFFRPIAA